MISCSFFYNCLTDYGVDFFTGVPDSLLKDFCAYVTDHTNPEHHIIASNEGGAIALACGHYLATNQPALVYMQNSGQGNAANPLVSLADADVYSIPILLLIGWRGEPGKKDEPQHVKQGKITLSFLNTLNIPYRILSDTNDDIHQCLEQVFKLFENTSSPVALIAKRGTFMPYRINERDNSSFELTREMAIKEVVNSLGKSDIIVSTAGKTSRELYEYREELDSNHSRDFLTVGSMGHASQVALGIAMAKPQRQVYCLDGDGAAIMHMGALTIIGSQKPANFKHIIINNGAHDSVGGQPTAGFSISFTDIAKGCGYRLCMSTDNAVVIAEKMRVLRDAQGPALLEIKVRRGARSNLGRPKIPPRENKISFMEFISD